MQMHPGAGKFASGWHRERKLLDSLEQ